MLIRGIIIVLSVIFVFRVLNVLNKTFKHTPKIKHHINYGLPLAELFIWIVLVIWILNYFYTSGNNVGLFITGLLLLLSVVPAFFSLRDFLSGIYLKLQNKISEGNYIEIDDLKGKIEKMGNFSMNIVDKYGNIKSVPYNKINSKIILKPGYNPNLCKINLVFYFPEHLKTKKIIPRLKTQLITTPWVAVSQPIIVENIEYKNKQLLIEVIVYALQKNYAENIKDMIDNYIKEW